MVIFKPSEPVAYIKCVQAAIKSIALLAVMALVACVQPPAAQAPANAQQALEMAVRDYEKVQLKTFETMLPANFIGRDSLLDATRRALNDQRNIRVEITEVQMQTTGASQALTFKWEKRFTRASSGANVTERGSMQTVLRRSGRAWIFESLPADSLFTR
jgi:PBP1b-binding outer membrane lipoprotein LpoB